MLEQQIEQCPVLVTGIGSPARTRAKYDTVCSLCRNRITNNGIQSTYMVDTCRFRRCRIRELQYLRTATMPSTMASKQSVLELAASGIQKASGTWPGRRFKYRTGTCLDRACCQWQWPLVISPLTGKSGFQPTTSKGR